jgi:hypothetical protein
MSGRCTMRWMDVEGGLGFAHEVVMAFGVREDER